LSTSLLIRPFLTNAVLFTSRFLPHTSSFFRSHSLLYYFHGLQPFFICLITLPAQLLTKRLLLEPLIIIPLFLSILEASTLILTFPFKSLREIRFSPLPIPLKRTPNLFRRLISSNSLPTNSTKIAIATHSRMATMLLHLHLIILR
jgi:hypothetical protein